MQSKSERLKELRDDSEKRYQTFVESWPTSKNYLSKEEFVRQGFYSLGDGDKVQCVYCNGFLKEWAPSDDILLEHSKHFPNCPYIKEPYKFSEFKDLQQRLDSYGDWSNQLTQNPEDLAQAGMFYLGRGDQTQCFWCGGILMDWEEGDIPMVEHDKWFKTCQWLQVLRKDPEFKKAELQLKKNCPNPKTSDKKQVQATLSPEDSLQKMGFKPREIQKAKEKLGKGEEISVESLVRAIVDLENFKSKELKSTQPVKNFDVKCLSGPKSADGYDPTCKICFDANFDVVFLPCGHILCCESCARSLSLCPLCRTEIISAKKIFLSD